MEFQERAHGQSHQILKRCMYHCRAWNFHSINYADLLIDQTVSISKNEQTKNKELSLTNGRCWQHIGRRETRTFPTPAPPTPPLFGPAALVLLPWVRCAEHSSVTWFGIF